MNTTSTLTADAARAAMVTRLYEARPGLDPRVANAMRAVPRDRFVPEATVEEAYADRAVITKQAAGGAPLSCASEPRIVAMMLDQLAVPAGARVLEIGAGTGYNAALLAELAGPSGQVTTIDIDPEVTAGARSALDATGYGGVQVITGDGGSGYAPRAPYDRIIATVGPWDVPPAWMQQLAPGGRLVVPIRWRGQARSIAFTRAAGSTLVSDSVQLCGFIPMAGPGQDGERRVVLAPDEMVTVHHDTDQPVSPDAAARALREPPATVWSGITVGPEDSFDGIWLRMAAAEPATCRITASAAAVEAGLCRPAIPARSPALAQNASLAYLALRRLGTTPPRFELGATSHGPNGPDLARRICAQIQAWNHAPRAQPTITLHPVDTSSHPALPGPIVKRWTRLTAKF
jgi:protein-L-isoaspartate(D-aspartate) O-methyltransferase